LDGIRAQIEAGFSEVSQGILVVCSRNLRKIRTDWAQSASGLGLAEAKLRQEAWRKPCDDRQVAKSDRLLAPILLLWLLLTLPAPAALPAVVLEGLDAPVAAGFAEQNLGDFRLYYHRVDQSFAAHVAGVVQASEQRLADELDLRNFRGSHIVVAWDPDHFYRLAGSGTPHWAGAVANPEQGRIVLKSPRWGDVERNAGATIRHEMTHLGVGRLRRGNWIPVWLEEGLAVRLSGMPYGIRPDGAGISLSKAITTGSLIPLTQLDNLHSFSSQQAELAYMEAESAVRFFLERHGRVALVHMLTLVGRGTGFNEAFDQATGGGYYRFESDWQDWLKSQRGLYFLMDFSSWVWGGIIVLAGVVWWIRRRRARRILDRWSREAEEEDDDEFLV
jgi:hypothetical protein